MHARGHIYLVGLVLGVLGCSGGESLAISAGAPVSAAVQGRITDCGRALSGAEVVFRIRQNQTHQARPVDAEVGPVTTGRDGGYVIEIGPSFAVPGPARLEIQAVNGISLELAGPDLDFALGSPPRDTLRLDADIGLQLGNCPG